MEADNKKGA